jgi:hypothetical protein
LLFALVALTGFTLTLTPISAATVLISVSTHGGRCSGGCGAEGRQRHLGTVVHGGVRLLGP